MNENDADLYDAVLDAYRTYKDYEEKANEYREKFQELSKIAFEKGMRSFDDMRLVRTHRTTKKVNSSKLIMLYPDVVKSLLKNHPDTIGVSASALKHIKEDISSCVDTSESEFYSLKEDKDG